MQGRVAGTPVENKPKLLDQVRNAIRVKHYSIRTEQAYIDWIKRFILFHGKRHPAEMGEEEVARCSRVGLAICLSFFTDLARSAQRQSTATSYRRGNIAERSQESGPRLWDSKTGQLSQSASLLCYSPAATWLRHSHGSGAVRAQRREHDDDLHACPQQTRHRCEESAGL